MAVAAEESNACEQSRREEVAGIRQDGARADSPVGPVDAVVDEVEPALVGESRLTRETDQNLPAFRTGGRRGHVLQVRLLVGVEIHVDGIDRDDGGQQGR